MARIEESLKAAENGAAAKSLDDTQPAVVAEESDSPSFLR